MERRLCPIEVTVPACGSQVGQAAGHLRISLLEGEMACRPEGGGRALEPLHRPQSFSRITEEGSKDSQTLSSHCATRSLSAARRELTLLTCNTVPVASRMR